MPNDQLQYLVTLIEQNVIDDSIRHKLVIRMAVDWHHNTHLNLLVCQINYTTYLISSHDF